MGFFPSLESEINLCYNYWDKGFLTMDNIRYKFKDKVSTAKISTMLISALIINPLFAEEVYVVKKGDVLSKIIKKNYPDKKIFGRNGMLKSILQINPHIKNPNLIFINQKITLIKNIIPVAQIEKAQTESNVIDISLQETEKKRPEKLVDSPPKNESLQVEAKDKAEEKMTSRNISLVPRLDDMSLAILYGAKFVSHEESGALGSSKLGVLFLNDLKFLTNFHFEDFQLGLEFESYKFKYESLNSSNEKQIYSLGIEGAYKGFLGGFGVHQTPIFRNNAGTVQMAKLSLIEISLGKTLEYALPTKKPTYINLKAEVTYPLSGSTDNAQIKTNSISGYGANAEFSISRLITSKNDYSFYFKWPTSLNFRSLKGSTVWDTTSGNFELKTTEMASNVGLEVNF
jgi:hypothetical protein